MRLYYLLIKSAKMGVYDVLAIGDMLRYNAFVGVVYRKITDYKTTKPNNNYIAIKSYIAI